MEPVPEAINDMMSVDSRLTVASAVILYVGPAFSLFIASPLRTEPVLQLLVFAGALFGLFSIFIPGITSLGLSDGNSEVSTSNMNSLFNNRVVLIVLDTIFHDVMRFWLVYLIVKGERFFRRNGQVLYHSNLRMLPLGASAGFGFGFLRGLCVVASSASVTMQVESTTSNAGFVRNAPASLGSYVNLDSCASMPLLVQQSTSHLFAFFGDIIWTLMFMPIVAGVMLDSENTSMVPDNGNNDNTNSNNTISTTNSPLPSSPMNTDESAATGKNTKKEKDPRWYEPTTTNFLQQILFLALAIATHIVFGVVSLVNTDAVDFASSLIDKERGCTVSLTVQAIMVFVAGCASCYLILTIEKFPAHLMKMKKVETVSANQTNVVENNNNIMSRPSSSASTSSHTGVTPQPSNSSTNNNNDNKDDHQQGDTIGTNDL